MPSIRTHTPLPIRTSQHVSADLLFRVHNSFSTIHRHNIDRNVSTIDFQSDIGFEIKQFYCFLKNKRANFKLSSMINRKNINCSNRSYLILYSIKNIICIHFIDNNVI